MCAKFTVDNVKVESTPGPPSPSIKSLKVQFSKIALIRKLSTSDIEVNPFTVLTIHQVLILVCSIVVMTVVLQIPTILYFDSSTPPAASSSFTSEIDFKTCSVSSYI